MSFYATEMEQRTLYIGRYTNAHGSPNIGNFIDDIADDIRKLETTAQRSISGEIQVKEKGYRFR